MRKDRKHTAGIIKNGNEEELNEVNEKLTVKYLQEQREDLEKGYKSLKETWKDKGRSASIFKLKEIVVGPKKPQQEPTSVKDPETKKWSETISSESHAKGNFAALTCCTRNAINIENAKAN